MIKFSLSLKIKRKKEKDTAGKSSEKLLLKRMPSEPRSN